MGPIYVECGVEGQNAAAKIWWHVPRPGLQQDIHQADGGLRSDVFDAADPRVAREFQLRECRAFGLEYDDTDRPNGLYFLLADSLAKRVAELLEVVEGDPRFFITGFADYFEGAGLELRPAGECQRGEQEWEQVAHLCF